MPKPIAVTPTYASGDLAGILEVEQRQIEDTVADLSEEQVTWRPNAKAKSALDILWHIAYSQEQSPRPSNKLEALDGLRRAHAALERGHRKTREAGRASHLVDRRHDTLPRAHLGRHTPP